MAIKRRADPAEGRVALLAWQDGVRDRAVVALAVRFSLEELADIAPGHAVEVRVPPWGAVQAVEGPRHTRGTPPNVVEMHAQTWLALACGTAQWATEVEAGRIDASGDRADLSPWLPLQAARRR